MKNNKGTVAVNFLELLLLVFVILKLTKVIAWSWLWVLSPIWIPFLVWLFIIGIAWLFIVRK